MNLMLSNFRTDIDLTMDMHNPLDLKVTGVKTADLTFIPEQVMSMLQFMNQPEFLALLQAAPKGSAMVQFVLEYTNAVSGLLKDW